MLKALLAVIIFLGLSISISLAAPKAEVEELLIQKETSSWQAAKDKNYDQFESLLADDFVDVFASGEVHNKKEIVDYIRGVDLTEFHLTNFKVIMLNVDAAIVVYEARARATESHGMSRGKPVSEIHAAVTSAWAKRSGKWLNVFYRESDLPLASSSQTAP